MGEHITDVVRDEFDKRKKITLKELYQILSKNSNLDIEPSKLKHRIRSTLYSLQQSNEVRRIEKSTYEKI